MNKKKNGRPTLLNETLKEQMLRMYKLGLTDKQVAEVIDVDEQTITNWKKDDNFFGSIKECKQIADDLVEQALFKRATGHKHKAVKIFYDPRLGETVEHEYIEEYPPDPTSMIFWLKNRQPKKWRDKQEIDHTTEDGKGLKITLNYARKGKE
jgi:DNA-binding XRE family transcriptional regulator